MKYTKNEKGLSLVEVILSVGLLGVVFSLLSILMFQNQKVVEFTRRKEEAQAIKKDIKEWMGYRAQTQDIANLNEFVLNNKNESDLTQEEKIRRHYLILDETGIQKDESGNVKYGEIAPKQILEVSNDADENIDRKKILRKVEYCSSVHDLNDTFLPDRLKNQENALYMGRYIEKKNEKEKGYLVSCEILENERGPLVSNLKAEGIDICLSIYDGESGSLLTETIFKWIVDY